ncbi:MAG: hypothetical protein LBN95_02225 [Prevotellaceae bacterium]|jgi:hypothetical protein|nr:hypothetical protein [Prevotellaceae bacterium]
MKKFILIFTLVATGIFFTSCDKGADIAKGKLKGTTWVYNWDYYGTYIDSETHYTYTFSFISDNEGKLTRTGWYRIENKRENVNQSQTFTYILKEGVITCASAGIRNKGGYPFTISDDFKTLSIGSETYTRN